MWQSEQKEKDTFAAEWLRNSDPFKAALAVFGMDNAGRALLVSSDWVHDDYVLKRKAALLDEFGEDYFLPSKAAIAQKVLAVHDKAMHADDKLKALRLYAELMGHITKPEANAKPNIGVIAVPVNAEDAKL